MELPQRRRPARQPVYQVGKRSAIVFVTVCTVNRKAILADRAVHRLLIAAWEGADHWAVGRYVIMPEHIHLFCAPARVDHVSIKRWIAYWKSQASRTWSRREDHPIWQIDGWDTQLRRGDSYHAKWEYVRNNPVRHGLVSTPESWPYQGEITPLWWDD